MKNYLIEDKKAKSKSFFLEKKVPFLIENL